MELFRLGFGAIFVYNLVLAQFLGLCPFIGVSKKKGPLNPFFPMCAAPRFSAANTDLCS